MIANRITTGTTGLDTILRGGLPPNRLYLLEGQPGSGKTTASLQFLLDGAAKGELPVRDLVGNHRRAQRSGRLARLVAGGAAYLRAGIGRSVSGRWTPAVHPASVGNGAGRHHQADPVRGGPGQADACGVRLAVRVAPAGAGFAALSASGAGAQAVLCTAQHHRVPGRRPHRRERRTRCASAQPVPRGDFAGTHDAGFRCGAAAHAGAEIARRGFHRRLPRHHHHHRRHADLSAADRLRSPCAVHRRCGVQWRGADRCAAAWGRCAAPARC